MFSLSLFPSSLCSFSSFPLPFLPLLCCFLLCFFSPTPPSFLSRCPHFCLRISTSQSLLPPFLGLLWVFLHVPFTSPGFPGRRPGEEPWNLQSSLTPLKLSATVLRYRLKCQRDGSTEGSPGHPESALHGYSCPGVSRRPRCTARALRSVVHPSGGRLTQSPQISFNSSIS